MSLSKLGYNSGDRPIADQDYLLEHFLGAGNFGEAWSSTAPGGVRVALKIIDLTRTDGEREFDALEKIKHVRHPNLTPIHALWTIDDIGNVLQKQFLPSTRSRTGRSFEPKRLVVAMGLGDKCLAKRLKECNAEGKEGIPRGELLRYMEGAAKGLDFLHSPVHFLDEDRVAVIHRDIKPHNILVVGDDAQICDFGLARAVAKLQGKKSRTRTRAGTDGFLAPEVLLDSRPATARSDQYSFAISYILLRTSRMPYGTDVEWTEGDVLRAHWNDGLNLTMLDRAERRVVAKATDNDPHRRFTCCAEFVEELRHADNNKSTTQWLIDLGSRLMRREEETADRSLVAAVGSTNDVATPIPASAALSPEGDEMPDEPPATENKRHPLDTANTTMLAMDGTIPEFSEGSLATEFDVPQTNDRAQAEEEPRAQPRRRRRLAMFSLLFVTVLTGIAAGVLNWWRSVNPPDPPDPYTLSAAWLEEVGKSLNAGSVEEAAAAFADFPSELQDPVRQETIEKASKAWCGAVTHRLDQMNPPNAKLLVQLAPIHTLADGETIRQHAILIWHREYNDRLERGNDFIFAGEMLQNAPEVNEIGTKTPLVDVLLEQWLRRSENCLNNGDWSRAGSLLEKLSRTHVTDRDTSPLVNALISQWSKELDSRLSNSDFLEAVELSKELARTTVEGQEPGISSQFETQWLDRLKQNWNKPDQICPVQDQAKHLLDAWPDSLDAQLIRARAIIRTGDPKAALTELGKIDRSALQPDRARFSEHLELIATASVPGADLAAVKLRIFQYVRRERSEQKEGFWQLDAVELKSLADTCQKLADMLLVDAQAAIAEKRFDEAMDALREAAELLEGNRKRIELLQAVGTLANPVSTADEISAALGLATRLLNSPQGEAQRLSEPEEIQLAIALGGIASQVYDSSTPDTHVTQALELMRTALELPAARTELAPKFASSLERQVHIQLRSSDTPTDAEWAKLRAAYECAEKGGSVCPLVRARLAEHKLDSGNVDQEVIDFGTLADRDIAEPNAAYLRYVRLRCRASGPNPSWDKVRTDVQEVLASDLSDDSPLAKADRINTLIAVVLDFAESQRSDRVAWDDPISIGNPFDQPSELDNSLLARLWDDRSENLNDNLRKRLLVSLALANYYNSEKGLDPDRLAGLAEELAELTDEDLGPYAGSVRFVAAVGAMIAPKHGVKLEDRMLAVRMSNRLLTSLNDANHAIRRDLADSVVVGLYRALLGPVDSAWNPIAGSGDAATITPQESQALEEFQAAVGTLLLDHQYASWESAELETELGQRMKRHFDRAIKLFENRNGKNPASPAQRTTLAGYLVKRGRSRLLCEPKELRETFQDAEAALMLVDQLPDAYGLRAHAFLENARSQSSREERLALIEDSMRDGQKAVGGPDESSPRRSYHLINLANALIDHASHFRGNTPEETRTQQEADLRAAIRHAEEAAKIEQDYPHFPALIQGNAYEDLAWLVRIDPSKNFLMARRAFSEAASHMECSQAYLGIGRCYYKAVVECEIAPSILGFESTADVLSACEKAFRKATDEDPNCSSAWEYLANVYLERAEYDEADKCFKECIRAAAACQDPNEFDYIWRWVHVPIKRNGADGLQASRARAQQYAGQANGSDPTNRATQLLARIDGKILAAGGDHRRALAEYGKGIPKDLAKARSWNMLHDWAASAENVLGENWDPATYERLTKVAKRMDELNPSAAGVTETRWLLFAVHGAQYRKTVIELTNLPKELGTQDVFRNRLLNDCRGLLESGIGESVAGEIRKYGIRCLNDEWNDRFDHLPADAPPDWSAMSDDDLEAAQKILRETVTWLTEQTQHTPSGPELQELRTDLEGEQKLLNGCQSQIATRKNAVSSKE